MHYEVSCCYGPHEEMLSYFECCTNTDIVLNQINIVVDECVKNENVHLYLKLAIVATLLLNSVPSHRSDDLEMTSISQNVHAIIKIF